MDESVEAISQNIIITQLVIDEKHTFELLFPKLTLVVFVTVLDSTFGCCPFLFHLCTSQSSKAYTPSLEYDDFDGLFVLGICHCPLLFHNLIACAVESALVVNGNSDIGLARG